MVSIRKPLQLKSLGFNIIHCILHIFLNIASDANGYCIFYSIYIRFVIYSILRPPHNLPCSLPIEGFYYQKVEKRHLRVKSNPISAMLCKNLFNIVTQDIHLGICKIHQESFCCYTYLPLNLIKCRLKRLIISCIYTLEINKFFLFFI